ncbi:MAG: flagellar export chaperone FliS [Sedimentibacter sp.]|uniref:flagellar export chaperone FliS n=1 Tax=Sedimentibacter sp. TaxID=1960295 RepID=UPI00315868D9
MISAFEQYKKTSVNTMTRGELLVLLYDEAIKKMNMSKMLMENNDFDNAGINLEKCRKIFNHLIVTLDDNYALSKDLREMYMFFNKELILASSKKSIKNIDNILPLVKDLRNTWEEADKIAKSAKS